MIERFRRDNRVFVILVAMEMLDTRACKRMADKLGGDVPIFSSAEYDMPINLSACCIAAT